MSSIQIIIFSFENLKRCFVTFYYSANQNRKLWSQSSSGFSSFFECQITFVSRDEEHGERNRFDIILRKGTTWKKERKNRLLLKRKKERKKDLVQICITDTDYHHFGLCRKTKTKTKTKKKTKIPFKWKRILTGVKVLVIKNGL